MIFFLYLRYNLKNVTILISEYEPQLKIILLAFAKFMYKYDRTKNKEMFCTCINIRQQCKKTDIKLYVSIRFPCLTQFLLREVLHHFLVSAAFQRGISCHWTFRYERTVALNKSDYFNFA